MSRAEREFWRDLGFDPSDPADWATMCIVLQDSEIADEFAWLRRSRELA